MWISLGQVSDSIKSCRDRHKSAKLTFLAKSLLIGKYTFKVICQVEDFIQNVLGKIKCPSSIPQDHP